MKTKVRKVKSSKNIGDRINGYGDYKVTFPHPITGKRIVEIYKDVTRAEAGQVLEQRVISLKENYNG